jgi:cytoskeletal protein RodZ
MNEVPKETAKPTNAPSTAKELPKESRLNRFLVRLVRWLLAILIVAGLGALLVIFALYQPQRTRLDQSQTEIEAAKGQIAELEAEVDSLSTIEAQSEELQAALDQAELHVAILSARADIASALLALEQDDAPKARLALSKTLATLKKVESLLEPAEQKVAKDMQTRLDLAIKGISDNVYAAASDLDVLMNALIELENTYFANP